MRLCDILEKLNKIPIEDGMEHLAEKDLAHFLQQKPPYYARGILRLTKPREDIIGFIAQNGKGIPGLVKCLGRMPWEIVSGWAVTVIRICLNNNDVEIRDAAIQAAENWGTREVMDVLREHEEAVSHLKSYIYDVLQEFDHIRKEKLSGLNGGEENAMIRCTKRLDKLDKTLYYTWRRTQE